MATATAGELQTAAKSDIEASGTTKIEAKKPSRARQVFVGLLALVIGYPYRLVFGPFDLGVIDMQRVGRVWIYLSLVFSVASAAQYARLFGEAVDAKDRKRSEQP